MEEGEEALGSSAKFTWFGGQRCGFDSVDRTIA